MVVQAQATRQLGPITQARSSRSAGRGRDAMTGSDEQQAQPPSAAPTTASAASQHGPSRTARIGANAQVAEESRQPGVQGLQPRDALGDLGSPSIDQARQLGGRVPAVPGVAPARDPGGILERDVEPPQVDDQAQVLDVRRSVLAVGVVPSGRTRQPARAFVEADGVRRDADLVGPVRRSSCVQQTLEWLRCQAPLEDLGQLVDVAIDVLEPGGLG